MVACFDNLGWIRFPSDPDLLAWSQAARPFARSAVADPNLGHLHVRDGTWFVGLDALPNRDDGQLPNGTPLKGAALDFIATRFGPMPPLHRAQISVTYPGYPRPRDGETEAAFGYCLRRDAAHVDGILPIGPEQRRMVREPHAFILGLPLTSAGDTAAPLVVWDGSHKPMQAAFRKALADLPPRDQSATDIAEAYRAARRQVFDTCPRRTIPTVPGEAILLHRMTLHGVAPWSQNASAGPDGRMIAYFRPEMSGGVPAWLSAP